MNCPVLSVREAVRGEHGLLGHVRMTGIARRADGLDEAAVDIDVGVAL
jgi:hypothetical protein